MRALTQEEIMILEKQGCRADDWGNIAVAERFDPVGVVRDVSFSGDIALGVFGQTVEDMSGRIYKAGLYSCSLNSVWVGDAALVRMADLFRVVVGRRAVIHRVQLIWCSGATSYANGEPANVLTEDGGRSLPLWRALSAQTAHLLVHLRGQAAEQALTAMIRCDAEKLAGNRSVIGDYCRVERSMQLKNVYLEEAAIVEGVQELDECYVASSFDAPAYIGEGVAAQRTIFQKSSRSEGGVRLTHCLVGEGTRLERGFSAEHSVFLANSCFAQGEASSALAGPLSVSHHKATLVLTCQCSFNTFGSSANASNHHFKLGPVHGGILQRGAKMGSGSYLYWPSLIGAYSSVLGRNNRNLDTRDFPFSLVIGEETRTRLIPGVNVFNSGLFRDQMKWLSRDNRRGIGQAVDFYLSNVLTPFVIQAMDRGICRLKQGLGDDGDMAAGEAYIPADRIEIGIKLYETAILFHTGAALFAAFAARHGAATPSAPRLAELLNIAPEQEAGEGEWRDWGGLLVSPGKAVSFLAKLEQGEIPDISALSAAYASLRQGFAESEWRWLAQRWRRENGHCDETRLLSFIAAWRQAVLFRHDCLLRDAQKEFAPETRIGFGLEHDQNEDFAQARGNMADNPVVAAILAETERCTALADAVLKQMDK